MKIISKYTDYYDYLTHIHGVDPVLVYDRRGNDYDIANFSGTLYQDDQPSTYYSSVKSYIFYICNKKYTLFVYRGKYYFDEGQLFDLFSILMSERKESLRWRHVYTGIDHSFPLTSSNTEYLRRRAKQFFETKSITSTEINKVERQPVLMQGWGKFKLPILSTTPIPAFLPAEKIYNEISMFLGWLNDNPEAPQITDNKSKIVAAGFDPKYSFRPKKAQKRDLLKIKK